MKHLKFSIQRAGFIGLGLAWQYDRVAICVPFLMLEISWRK